MIERNASVVAEAATAICERDPLWETTSDLFAILDGEHRLYRTNPAWYDILGWSEADLREMSAGTIIHPDDIATAHICLSQLRADGDRANFESRLARKAGGYIWLSWRVTRQAGQFFATGRDLSAVRALISTQRDLVHAGRIAMLGELTASIAHEVNQPLAAIAANGSAASRWLGKAEPDLDEANSAVISMVHEASRASEIISRIRSLAVRGDPQRLPCPVEALVNDCVELLRGQFRGLGIEVSVIAARRLPDVLVDRVQIQQVLINLLLNAAQAMAHAASDARTIEIAADASGDRVEISVTDTGPGLAATAESDIFRAFFTTKRDGMGMGLAIARNIVEAHAGTLELDRSHPRGARFVISLPFGHAAAA